MSGIAWFNTNRPLLRGDKIEDQNGRSFQVLKQVGSGISSRVYKVVEFPVTQNSRVFAVKMPADDDESLESVQYESRVLEYVCILHFFLI